jgi:DNA-binding response OmpR family regulator
MSVAMPSHGGGGMPPARRARTGAAAVFPVPSQRLAVVDVASELQLHAVISTMADRLGWTILHLTDRQELTWALRVNRPSAVLVVLAAGLPPTRHVVEQVRRAIQVPIAVLGDVSGPQSVSLIAAGADTVLATRMRDEELGARMLALVRRAAEGSDSGARYLQSGPLLVDLWQREATRDMEPLLLTNTEFRLLVCLMGSAGRVVPSSRIISRVWGWAGNQDGLNTLRICVARLRKKLGDNIGEPRYVVSARGTGYRFGAKVNELAAREVEQSVDDGGDMLLAERLARRCEELADAPDAHTAALQVARSLIQEGTVDAVGLHVIRGDHLQLVAHHGFSATWEEAAQELRLADSGFAAVETLTADEPLQLRRFSGKSGYPRTAALARLEFPGTYLFVPMRSGSQVVGVMGCHRHSPEPFGHLSITYLKAVAALCGVCLTSRWCSDDSRDAASTSLERGTRREPS